MKIDLGTSLAFTAQVEGDYLRDQLEGLDALESLTALLDTLRGLSNTLRTAADLADVAGDQESRVLLAVVNTRLAVCAEPFAEHAAALKKRDAA